MSGTRLAAVAIAVASLAAARQAHAYGGAKWFVDVSETCDREVASAEGLEREVGLACAAVGGTCRVVDSPADAELRATLACRDGEWSLETRTIEGAPLAKVDLAGPTEDRLRAAAVEIARDEAPERSLAIDSLRDALPGTDHGTKRRDPSAFSIAAAGRASAASEVAPSAGARLLAGARVGALTHWTFSGAYEAGGSGDGARSAFRAGTGFAWGAPLTPGPIGFIVEGGAVVDESRHVDPSPGRWGFYAYPQTHIGAFGQATVVVAIPRGPVRPYAGLSASAMTIPPNLAASVELGVAFAVF